MSLPSAIPDRLLALAGPVFVVLMVVGVAAFPAAPGGDVSPATDPAWLAAHVHAVIGQSYVRALAAVAFVAFSATVAAACRRALPSSSPLPAVALAGGALSGGLLLLGQAITLAAALQVDDGSTASTRAFAALQNGVLDMSSVPAALLFGAVGLTALRSALLPRWLTVLTLVGVPVALADAASYDGGPLESVGLAGLAYFLLWSVLTGLVLATRRRQELSPADERRGTMSFS